MENNNYYKEMHIMDRGDNNATRVPICFCIDRSISMNTIVEGIQYIRSDGEIGVVEGARAKKIDESDIDGRVVTRIDKVKEALNVFYKNLDADEDAKNACQIATVVFDDEAYLWENFTHYNKEKSRNVDGIKVYESETSNLPAAIETSLELINVLIGIYQRKKILYHRPILVLLTDGETTHETSEVARRVREMQEKRSLYLFPIALEKEAKSLLEQFTPDGDKIISVENIQELNKLFERISKSVSKSPDQIIAELDSCKF